MTPVPGPLGSWSEGIAIWRPKGLFIGQPVDRWLTTSFRCIQNIEYRKLARNMSKAGECCPTVTFA